MVLAIALFKFELDRNVKGKMEPKSFLVTSTTNQDVFNGTMQELLTPNDLYGLYFNHATGILLNLADQKTHSMGSGRLKDKPYKYLSYFHKEIDDTHYLLLAIFHLDEDVELFESYTDNLVVKLRPLFLRLAKGNPKDLSFQEEMREAIESEIKFHLFQISRLANMEKIQKVALIYATPEREKTLELLRNGPIARMELVEELEKIKPNINIDAILRPFTELNIIRRDWAKGVKDPKTGLVHSQGEYIFLIKDIILIRKPPEQVLERMKKYDKLRDKYMQKVKEFYTTYKPSEKMAEESKTLAKFLLDPDLFDFLGLMKERFFPKDKIPKITSEFVSSSKLLEDLETDQLIVTVPEDTKTSWYVLLGEVAAIVIFPEFLLTQIKARLAADKAAMKVLKGKESQKTRDETGLVTSPEVAVSPKANEMPADAEAPARFTTEVALKALKFLEETYYENIEI